MADYESGTLYTGTSSHSAVNIRLKYSYTQNYSTKTTRITVTMQNARYNTAWTSRNSNAYKYIQQDGVTKVDGRGFDVSGYSANVWYDIMSSSWDIVHNDDGTKTITLKGELQTGVTPGTLTCSQTITLHQIPVSVDMNIRLGDNVIKKAYVGTTEVKEVFYGDINIFPGYTRLEYIQSTGGQYINTGIQTNSNNFDKIEFEFKDNSAGSNREGVYFGSYDGLMLGTPTYKQTAYTFAVATTGSWKTSNPVITPNTNINTYVYNNGSNSINNTVFFNTVVTNSNKDIFLCKVNGYTPSNNKTLNVYSFKISKNNNLIRDFIPVKRKTDNKVGLYDLVEHKFYGNSGSGDFVAGPEV